MHDRRTFVDLRRSGLRLRSSSMGLTFLPSTPGAPTPPRVAFAIPRKVGNAVERNRLRRRLRASFQALTADPSLTVLSGAYLLSPRPTALTSTFEGLTMELRQLLVRLEALVARTSLPAPVSAAPRSNDG